MLRFNTLTASRLQRALPWGPSPTPLELHRVEFRARQHAQRDQLLASYRENVREQDRVIAENADQRQREQELERSLAPLRARLAEVIGEAEDLRLQIRQLEAVGTSRRIEDWEGAMRSARDALREAERKIEEHKEDIRRWYGWFYGDLPGEPRGNIIL